MVVGDSGWIQKEKVGKDAYRYERYLKVDDITKIGQLLKKAQFLSFAAGMKNAKVRFGKDATEIIIEGTGLT